MLPGYATAAAHYRSNFNIVIPQGFNRLDYLMTADMLDCIFSADSQESEDGQRKVNDIKIPEEFLDGEGMKNRNRRQEESVDIYTIATDNKTHDNSWYVRGQERRRYYSIY